LLELDRFTANREGPLVFGERVATLGFGLQAIADGELLGQPFGDCDEALRPPPFNSNSISLMVPSAFQPGSGLDRWRVRCGCPFICSGSEVRSTLVSKTGSRFFLSFLLRAAKGRCLART